MYNVNVYSVFFSFEKVLRTIVIFFFKHDLILSLM